MQLGLPGRAEGDLWRLSVDGSDPRLLQVVAAAQLDLGTTRRFQQSPIAKIIAGHRQPGQQHG